MHDSRVQYISCNHNHVVLVTVRLRIRLRTPIDKSAIVSIIARFL